MRRRVVPPLALSAAVATASTYIVLIITSIYVVAEGPVLANQVFAAVCGEALVDWSPDVAATVYWGGPYMAADVPQDFVSVLGSDRYAVVPVTVGTVTYSYVLEWNGTLWLLTANTTAVGLLGAQNPVTAWNYTTVALGFVQGTGQALVDACVEVGGARMMVGLWIDQALNVTVKKP